MGGWGRLCSCGMAGVGYVAVGGWGRLCSCGWLG